MNSEETVNFDDTTQEETIKLEQTILVVDEVKPHISNPKKMQAQLRQSMLKTYPEARIGNSLNKSIYGKDDFGFGDGETHEEKRVAWMDVPTGSTIESVTNDLAKFPNARIYKVLSLEPVITDEQQSAMESGFSTYTDDDGKTLPVTLDYYKTKTRVLNREDGVYVDYKGLPQYRVTGFSINGKQDVDLRAEQYAAYDNTEAFKLDEEPSKEEIRERVSNEDF